MEVPLPICVACSRFVGTTDLDVGPTCEAFPAGIPAAIWDDGFDHRQPFDGDGGVRFELADDEEAPKVVALFEKTKAYADSNGGE
jgi:hypothetical protein